jgi:hypothetical protein
MNNKHNRDHFAAFLLPVVRVPLRSAPSGPRSRAPGGFQGTIVRHCPTLSGLSAECPRRKYLILQYLSVPPKQGAFSPFNTGGHYALKPIIPSQSGTQYNACPRLKFLVRTRGGQVTERMWAPARTISRKTARSQAQLAISTAPQGLILYIVKKTKIQQTLYIQPTSFN